MTMSLWPRLNEHVEVRHESWSGWLGSRVAGSTDEDTSLVIAAPAVPTSTRFAVVAGDALSLRWGSDRGMALLDARVNRMTGGARPEWRLGATGPALLRQRRSFARVPVCLPVVVHSGGSVWPLTTIDLAEGGMRCAGRQERPWGRDEDVELRFEVDHQWMRTPAQVVWAGRTLAGSTVAFRFQGISRREADQLRSYVFRTQTSRARA